MKHTLRVNTVESDTSNEPSNERERNSTKVNSSFRSTRSLMTSSYDQIVTFTLSCSSRDASITRRLTLTNNTCVSLSKKKKKLSYRFSSLSAIEQVGCKTARRLARSMTQSDRERGKIQSLFRTLNSTVVDQRRFVLSNRHRQLSILMM